MGFCPHTMIHNFTLPSTMVLYFSKEIHFFQGDLRKWHQFWKESSQGRSSKLNQNCSKRSYSNTQNGSWISTTPNQLQVSSIPSYHHPPKKKSLMFYGRCFFFSIRWLSPKRAKIQNVVVSTQRSNGFDIHGNHFALKRRGTNTQVRLAKDSTSDVAHLRVSGISVGIYGCFQK